MQDAADVADKITPILIIVSIILGFNTTNWLVPLAIGATFLMLVSIAHFVFAIQSKHHGTLRERFKYYSKYNWEDMLAPMWLGPIFAYCWFGAGYLIKTNFF